jgi:hypothetical protein
MAEVLTKAAIKAELKRRIAWFERAYGFNAETTAANFELNSNVYLAIQFGRYRALTEMLWQVENRMFIHGFVC